MRRRPWWLLLLLGCVLAAGAGSAEPGDDLDRNRRLLDKWRADPEHHARLQRDLRAFYALPRARQEQLRLLDRQLHEGELTTQTRLWSVLERYASWLENLPEPDRQRLSEAPTPATRLAVIRELRMREWLVRLPERLRVRVEKLPLDRQAGEVARIRQEERRQRTQWAKHYRPRDETPMRPTRLTEFPGEIQRFVREKVLPRLGDEEKQRLAKVEGKWPDYARTVRELSAAHPVLPPLPGGEIKRWEDLPPAVRKRLPAAERRANAGALKKLTGSWPEFALEVARILETDGSRVPPLGASRPEEFPFEIQAFLRNQMLPKLTPLQRDRLAAAEGKWPAYPKTLILVARERRLVIPGMCLPGPFYFWESTRAALPAVPDRLLRQFALHELTPQQRAELQLSAADPLGSYEKVKKAYFRQKQADEERKKRKLRAAQAGSR